MGRWALKKKAIALEREIMNARQAAREAAKRWCGALLQPVSHVWPAERGFPSTMTAAAFALLADLAGN